MRRQTRRQFLKRTGMAVGSAALPVGRSARLIHAASLLDTAKAYQVGAYYFPNYHVDPRNEEVHGKGWTEWELVKQARPRFKGHRQPRVPTWGYLDEADPKVMEKKIDAAADHGVDYWIFDWYWYNDGPFLNRCLENGYLRAANNRRVKFCCMWTNHNWRDIQPARPRGPQRVLYPGAVTRKTFEVIVEHVIGRYFKHPSYRRIVRGQPNENQDELVRRLGFDSVTTYGWIDVVPLNRFPQTDYRYVQDRYFDYWRQAEKTFELPYYPNVTMGWDSSPRTDQSVAYGNFGYPYMPTITNNTPQRFHQVLLAAKQRLDQQEDLPRILNINAWNEWTEGSYLEPDSVYSMAYLEAIRDVFG